jgi:hypothetical protein
MMSPAPQHQLGQVGGAAIQPGTRWWASPQARGRSQPGEPTAPPPGRPGRRAGRAGRPGSPFRGPGAGSGPHPGPVDSSAMATGSCSWSPPPPRGVPGGQARVLGCGSVGAREAGVMVGVVVVVGVAGGQHPGHRPLTGQPPTALGIQRSRQCRRRPSRAGPAGCPGPPSPAAGAGPTALGQPTPPAPAGPARPGHRPGAGPAAGVDGVGGRASGSRAANKVWPASASNNPSRATMPSQVGASHSPRRPWRTSARSRSPSGSATSRSCPRTRRSRGGSRGRAASSRTGSASVLRWSGSGNPSRSWATTSWTAAASPASPSGRPPGCLLECVFDSMGGTYQAPTQRQPATQICGQLSRGSGPSPYVLGDRQFGGRGNSKGNLFRDFSPLGHSTQLVGRIIHAHGVVHQSI